MVQSFATIDCRMSRLHVIAAALLALACLLPAAAEAQERVARPVHRRLGTGTLHAAVGTNNGARIGALFFVHEHIAPELSLGYVRLVSRYVTPERTWEESASAAAVGVGVNLYPFPISDISPFVTFGASYVRGLERVGGEIQNRVTAYGTLGTEVIVAQRFGGFFRLGPSVSIVRNAKDDGTKLGIQLDAGLLYRF